MFMKRLYNVLMVWPLRPCLIITTKKSFLAIASLGAGWLSPFFHFWSVSDDSGASARKNKDWEKETPHGHPIVP